jgi:hypothetical protein
LERQVEALYDRVQLRPEYAQKLRDALQAVGVLREDQNRIGREIREVEELLRSAQATLAGWTEVIGEAVSFATGTPEFDQRRVDRETRLELATSSLEGTAW